MAANYCPCEPWQNVNIIPILIFINLNFILNLVFGISDAWVPFTES